MGTNQGGIATEAPPAIRPQTSFSADKFGLDPSRSKSLKRAREQTPTSPNSNNPDSADSHIESPSKSARLAGQTSRRSQSPLVPTTDLDATVLVAYQTTREALEKDLASTIMASASLARPDDPASVSGPASSPAPQHPQEQAPAVPAIAMARPADQPKLETSPQSSSSMPSLSGPTHVTTSPEAMDVDNQSNRPAYGVPEAQLEERPTSSMSYPPIPAASSNPVTPNMPQRTATHPIPGAQEVMPHSPSSANNKKHKCPYCETEFTRHHNLKSHLLTHSHEKPYECSTCQMRFRRLHDLKRHSKLHTGEKPHICPKCDRKFARGDALARHSKGAGGCAGRRHSLPFDGDTSNFEGQGNAEGDDSVMAGVQYEGTTNEVEISEEDRQRLSMANAYTTAAAAHSRTYPPAGTRSSSLYPPNADRSTGNTASNVPNNLTSHAAIATASLYAQNAMTESPKPLSPHSSAAQANQQHLNRRPSDGLSLTSSHNNVVGQPPKASGLAGFTGLDGRYAGGLASGAHSRNSAGPNVESGNMFSPDQVWSYVSALENTVKQLMERVEAMEKDKDAQISQLAGELSALRQQMLEHRQEETLPVTAATVPTAPAPIGLKD